jgi:cytochrome c oxidase subunit 2
VVVLVAGCGSDHSAVNPQSSQQRSIADLFWVMMGAAWLGFGVVVLLLFLGWLRRNRSHLPFGGGEGAATALVLLLGVAVPIAVLSTLFLWADVFVVRSTAAPKPGTTALTVHVTAHQWFWEVRYQGTRAVTANEIHIPARTPVRVIGTTDDVIHSFWVPALNRKIDLIPGRRNSVLLEADRPGVYRGQCSEYCGIQHAHMALAVYVQPRAAFRAWLGTMARPARAPRTALQRHGRQVFLTEACASCHTIRGTMADGTVGPDLTHVRARHTLAALTIPNDLSHLLAWIRDPQQVKPGTRMPTLDLTQPQLDAVAAYLRSLR